MLGDDKLVRKDMKKIFLQEEIRNGNEFLFWCLFYIIIVTLNQTHQQWGQ